MFKIVRKEFQYGNQQVVLETGRIARQATGAAGVQQGVIDVEEENARHEGGRLLLDRVAGLHPGVCAAFQVVEPR